MPDLARFCRRLATTVSLTLLAAAGTAVAAQAEGYGEIEAARFGSLGAGEGQFETQEAAGFGVDPTNNDVYVVDLPETGKVKPGGTGKEKFKPNEFIVQRFDPNSKGEYGKPVAFATFKPKDEALKEDEEIDEVTNIAVDPSKHKIYVLTSEQRPQGLDGVTMAASELWAFDIEGEQQLTGQGVLAGTKVFKPQAGGLGESLENPGGIAVDPTNHDVIVLGEEEKGEGHSVTALERINGETGALAEKRWSDPTAAELPEGFLEDEGTSPVVTKSGEVLVVHGGEVDEVDKIPTAFNTEAPATPVFEANPEVEEEPALVKEQLTSFPGTADFEPRGGGALSLGEEGTLYASAAITEQDPEKHHGELNGPLAPGVLEFSSKGGAEKEWADEGWTGGQSIATVGATGGCKVSINVYSQVAAGSEHHVFVFDENPEGPRIVEFGPEGKGCPGGTVTAPTASTLSSGGKPIEPKPEDPIPIKDVVKLSSNLVQLQRAQRRMGIRRRHEGNREHG